MKAQIVLEEEDFVAFRDINPKAPVHILLIPKEHMTSLSETKNPHEKLLGRMMLGAKEIAQKEGIDENGYRLVMNKGIQAGQTVFHLHLHLLGGRSFSWPPG